MSTVRRVAIVLVLVTSLALAGCTLQPEDTEYPDEGEIRDQLGSVETVEADVVTETAGPNGTTERMHIERDFRTGAYRATITDGPATGTTLVSNGTRAWYYASYDNAVHVLEEQSGESALANTVDTVSTIFGHLGGGDDDGSVGISPAPTVPAAGEAGASDQRLELPIGDSATVEDVGTESVDGREARIVSVDVEEEAALVENVTYWFDREWYFPLKSRVGVRIGNETTVATTTYTNVSFNEPVAEEDFTFDPPPTARVVEGSAGSLQSFDSREALTNATNHAVPTPSVPSEYAFETGEIAPAGANETIRMFYVAEGRTLTVSKLVSGESTLQEDAERVEVGGQPGRLIEVGPNEAVVWTCDGNTYSVLGPSEGVPLEEIATSMACE